MKTSCRWIENQMQPTKPSSQTPQKPLGFPMLAINQSINQSLLLTQAKILTSKHPVYEFGTHTESQTRGNRNRQQKPSPPPNQKKNTNLPLTIDTLRDFEKAIRWPSIEKPPEQRHTPMRKHTYGSLQKLPSLFLFLFSFFFLLLLLLLASS